MKILFFSPPSAVSRALGGSKVVVELVEEMTRIGWKCDIISIAEIKQLARERKGIEPTAPEALREYLISHADSYDVVDYDHSYLPFRRQMFPLKPLFVARSVLLVHHFAEIHFPTTFLNRIKSFLLRRRRVIQQRTAYQVAHATLQESDLVNVSNQRDREVLVRHGIRDEKIVVLPYGIDARRRLLFDTISDAVPRTPKVVFVGTFDFRKGCVDFPKIVTAIAKLIPEVSFRLFGTAGLYQTEAEVRAFFPRALQGSIEILPQYAPDDLPALLSDCSVGIFPSYIEGFGFGVIEMLAAAIPVIAYDSPGPCDILGEEFLVPPGDTNEMARRVISLLRAPDRLHRARVSARERSQRYRWSEIAERTSSVYLNFWSKKQDQRISVQN